MVLVVTTFIPGSEGKLPSLEGIPADVLELRLDRVPPDVVDDLLAQADRPVLAACRRQEDGGREPLEEDQRRQRLQAALDAGADLVDVERDAPFRDEIQQAAQRANAHVIVSDHDTTGTPSVDELLDRIEAMRPGADVVKIATHVDDDGDVGRLIQAAIRAPRLGVPFALMGLQDRTLRALAGPLGMALVYAAPAGDQAAPGQLPVDMQSQLPRTPTTPEGSEDYVLLGHPVSHSLSPRMQNAAFHHEGVPARYRLVDVPPDRLDVALEGLAATGTRGGNTTAPHKTQLYEACDRRTETAEACQAVNTFRFEDGRLHGHMTDGLGLVDALTTNGHTIQNRDVLLLGAGGTAKAAAHALSENGASLVLANRTRSKAKRIAQRLDAEHLPLEEDALGSAIGKGTIVVNATPVDPPVPDAVLPDAVAFDANYGHRARFAQRARDQGASVLDGLSLLTHQGVRSLAFWLDRSLDEDTLGIMQTAARTGALEKAYGRQAP